MDNKQHGIWTRDGNTGWERAQMGCFTLLVGGQGTWVVRLGAGSKLASGSRVSRFLAKSDASAWVRDNIIGKVEV